MGGAGRKPILVRTWAAVPADIESRPTIRSARCRLSGSKNSVTLRRSPAALGANTGASAPMIAPCSGSSTVQVAVDQASW